MTAQPKNKTLGQTIGDLLANVLVKPVRKFIAWGKKNPVATVVVTFVLAGASALSVAYFGVENAVENMIEEEQAAALVVIDPSGTVIETPATVEP